MAKPLQADRIGTKAETLLRRPGRHWGVLAAVGGAIYIADEDGELLWITDRGSALHARAIQLPSMPFHVPLSGLLAESDGRLLRCEHFALGWHNASLWAPAPFTDVHEIGRSNLAQAIEAIEQVLHATSAEWEAPENDLSTRVGRQLTEAVDRLRRVSTEQGVLAGCKAVAAVVGLGEGLTPQGDDFLGGYLFALRALDGAYCLRFNIDWESVTAWLYSVEHRTNAISHCLLVDHAHGDACAPLVALIRGALEGESRDRLAQLASDVAEIGASSGRSLLEGVLSAYDVARTRRGSSQHALADGIREAVGRPARREVARVR